jgi:site-specific DNA-methyltransferase (cytosine-N4-specific)
MGSGTRPPNAYVTHEHESILVFRNGESRRPDPDRRDRSAYFWEERNEWFSDLWEVRGDRQSIPERDRAAAYPLEVPYRLVNMYSVRGETVLDPFLGTGTTTAAAMASARHSVGVECDPALLDAVERRVDGAPGFAAGRNAERVGSHRAAAADREMAHESAAYGFSVMTAGERELRLPSIERVVAEEDADRAWRAEHGVYRP